MALRVTYTEDYTTKHFQLHKFPIPKLIKKTGENEKKPSFATQVEP
jgi:hypothetical protein